jgi:DNA invertase Pin-like site-specific DNA recombinase
MSTDRQVYSTAHQRARLQQQAHQLGLVVVAEYLDRGKSGLTIKGRPEISRLLADVLSGGAEFSAVLVYDVSRWGRFQDVDEVAHYEYICRRAGIRVIYCAEQFDDDGSPLSGLLKSIKRTMAAEYSRELSAKVFAAQCRLTEMGFGAISADVLMPPSFPNTSSQ